MNLSCPAEFHRQLLAELFAFLYCSHAFHVQILCYLPGAVFGFRLCPLFYVCTRMSPAFLFRAGGRISTRSPACIVFVFYCVRLPEVFVLWLTVNLPIGEGFRRLSSRDGQCGVVNDGDDQGEW
jgi:hypothetical protein